jgi:hypothetical protein
VQSTDQDSLTVKNRGSWRGGSLERATSLAWPEHARASLLGGASVSASWLAGVTNPRSIEFKPSSYGVETGPSLPNLLGCAASRPTENRRRSCYVENLRWLIWLCGFLRGRQCIRCSL